MSEEVPFTDTPVLREAKLAVYLKSLFRRQDCAFEVTPQNTEEAIKAITDAIIEDKIREYEHGKQH